MGITKNYHDKKWILQFLDALYNSIDIMRKEQESITPAINAYSFPRTEEAP
jgi:hypothetical protein